MSLFQIPQAFAQTPEEIVGEIEVPKGVDIINTDAGGNIGIVLFLSNAIKFFIILGGIWALVNIVLAGFQYITGGGKTEVAGKVRDRFTMSFIGILLMILAYSVAAILGLVFYGSGSYFLTPTITSIFG